MYDYQVGGNAVKIDASEGMADIPMNRSLFVQKLTSEEEARPAAVEKLQTVEDVFAHYKPSVEVEFETAEGIKEEQIRFNTLGDFKSSAIIAQSPFLQGLASDKDDYQKVMKQLKANKAVGKVLENPDTHAAFLNAINSLIAELDDNK